VAIVVEENLTSLLKVIIRADGSKQIGMGHLSRCVMVAQRFLARGHSVKLVMKDDSHAKLFMTSRSAGLTILSVKMYSNDEISTVRNVIDEEQCDVFILDVLDDDTYKPIIEKCRQQNILSVLITDRTSRISNFANIVLDGSPSQLYFSYDDCNSAMLMGPKYFLMNPIYEEIRVDKPDYHHPKNIFISMGGADQNGLLFILLNLIEEIDHSIFMHVYSSEASGYREQLDRLLVDQRKKYMRVVYDSPTLTNEWGKYDIAITAGGNTLFERIAAGLPGATLCQLKRQMNHANEFQDMGVNVNLGYGPTLDKMELKARIESFLWDVANHRAQHERSPHIINGEGVNLLYDEILKYLKLR
jgi:UDP-2,4-diacetamido-2,4,6-trideoxy-beta-L-altropyranose hydrolase